MKAEPIQPVSGEDGASLTGQFHFPLPRRGRPFVSPGFGTRLRTTSACSAEHQKRLTPSEPQVSVGSNVGELHACDCVAEVLDNLLQAVPGLVEGLQLCLAEIGVAVTGAATK
jgi:hypothetical protein